MGGQLPGEPLARLLGRRVDVENLAGCGAGDAAVVGAAKGESPGYAAFLLDAHRSTAPRRLEECLGRLWLVQTVDELGELVRDYPELQSEAARDRLSAWLDEATDDDERRVAAAGLELLRAVERGELDRGIEGYIETVRELLLTSYEPEINRLMEQIASAHAVQDWRAAVCASEELLEQARTIGAAELELLASTALAASLAEDPSDGRADRIERAIGLLERVIEILDERPDLDDRRERAEALGNLGSYYGLRPAGDPAANLERSLDCQRESLDLLSMSEDGETWAIAQTNVALSHLELAKQVRDEHGPEGTGGEEDEGVDAAIEHLQEALRFRSYERDPRNWAFTQINFGLAYALRSGGRSSGQHRAGDLPLRASCARVRRSGR